MAEQNNEWVGGKQVYGTQQPKPEKKDWLDELTDEDLGFVKQKPKSRTVEIEKESTEK